MVVCFLASAVMCSFLLVDRFSQGMGFLRWHRTTTKRLGITRLLVCASWLGMQYGK